MELTGKIEEELTLARAAEKQGNLGKARVCARRAVAKAYANSSLGRDRNPASLSAIQCLKFIEGTTGISEKVRDASSRLLTSVAEKSGASISTAPVEDALVIIDALY